MSKYTTGEIAKLCGVTVRTVQYYDTRGILIPSELSEGGRRLYTENDLDRMRVICFLRELGLSIDTISQLLSEPDPGSVISLLLEQQERALKEEMAERRDRMEKLEAVRRGLKSVSEISVESIGDIAYTMSGEKKLKKLHIVMLLTAIPVSLLEIAAIVLWAAKGLWWMMLVWAAIAIPWGIWFSLYYYRNTAYLCPQCHKVFRPSFREMFFAPHTPKTRKLTCTNCGHKGYCVEVAASDKEEVK